MPRIQLWNNEKTRDFHYQDRLINEQINMSGTSCLVHKYLGPAPQGETNDPAQPNLGAKDGFISELDIQDLLFVENRDRIYDTDIYDLRGVYQVSDQDFDLSQFGLFLSADTLFITFHTNEMVRILGRKLMAGDVIELPHLNDDLLLDATAKSINKFYVVQDAARSAEGFGPHWYPHLWRIKCAPMQDAQEYRNILGDPEDEDSLKNALSTYQKEIEISKAVIESAEKLIPNPGWEGENVFNDVPLPEYGKSQATPISVNTTPNDLTTVPQGLTFPTNPQQGDFFIRSDFVPGRLFTFRGSRWHRIFDNVAEVGWREKTVNAGKFIENSNTTQIADKNSESGSLSEKQPLSRVFKPIDPDD
jgi:hypothetical protein